MPIAMPRQLASANPSDHGISAEIVDAWNTAVKSKSKATKNALFMAFLKAGKNWGQLLGPNLVRVHVWLVNLGVS